jgi:Flp pilus assembly protein TadG
MAADMSELRGWAAEDRGQSLVEIALCLPILLLLVLGTVDVGRIYATKIAMTNAAREAAAFAARNPQVAADGAGGICQRARDELGVGGAASPCTTAPITVTCTRAPSIACGSNTDPVLYQTDGAAGADVTVTVSYRMSLLSTYLVSRAFTVNPITVSGSAVFVGLGQ